MKTVSRRFVSSNFPLSARTPTGDGGNRREPRSCAIPDMSVGIPTSQPTHYTVTDNLICC